MKDVAQQPRTATSAVLVVESLRASVPSVGETVGLRCVDAGGEAPDDRVCVMPGEVSRVVCRVAAERDGAVSGCCEGAGGSRCVAGTALCRSLVGLAAPESGRVLLKGEVAVGPRELREPALFEDLPDGTRIGYVVGGEGLLPQASAAMNASPPGIADGEPLVADLMEDCIAALGLRALVRSPSGRAPGVRVPDAPVEADPVVSSVPHDISPEPHQLTPGERLRVEVAAAAGRGADALVVEMGDVPEGVMDRLENLARLRSLAVLVVLPARFDTGAVGSRDPVAGAIVP